MIGTKTSHFFALLKGFAPYIAFAVVFLIFNNSVFAQTADYTFAKTAKEAALATNKIPNFITYLAYIIGTAFAVWGLLDVRAYTEKPADKPIKIGLSKLGVGGLLFAIPYVADVYIKTIGGSGLNLGPTFDKLGRPLAANASGQEGFFDLIKYITAQTNILPNTFVYVSYIIATALVVLSLLGFRKAVEDPSRNTYKIPIVQMVVAGFLFAIPFLAQIVYNTMTFGGTAVMPYVPGQYRFGMTQDADTLGTLIDNTRKNISILPDFAAYISYVIGTYFAIRGIILIKDHANDPRTPIAEGIKRLVVAGLSFSIPFIALVVSNTVLDGGLAYNGGSGWSLTPNAAGAANGLDDMFINLAKNTINPLMKIIEVFSYIAGIFFVVFGLQRLIKNSQAEAKGPLGFGTMSMFIVAAALMSLPQMVAVMNNTIFGTPDSLTKITFMATGGLIDPDLQKNAENVISACVAFIGVIGYTSILRGLFIFKSYADGSNQATIFSASTHLVAGAVAVNLGQFVNFMQNSLGLTSMALTFG